MTRIFLIGYMGAGKTTLGKALAHDLGLAFIDLDWHIEECYRKSVQQIFEEKGEQGFREIEHRMLCEVAEFEDVVVSAGGGTPCFFDNMKHMNECGETVFLEAAPEVLFRRLRLSCQHRPLLASKTDDELRAFIHESLRKRLPFYREAKHVFCADELEDKEQIKQSVERFKKQMKL